MKWLNLDLIKQQLRMEHDFILEDDLLTLYGDSAEDAVLRGAEPVGACKPAVGERKLSAS